MDTGVKLTIDSYKKLSFTEYFIYPITNQAQGYKQKMKHYLSHQQTLVFKVLVSFTANLHLRPRKKELWFCILRFVNLDAKKCWPQHNMTPTQNVNRGPVFS